MKLLVEERTPKTNSYVVNWHSHPFWQLDYYPNAKGGHIFLRGKTMEIKPGEAYLFRPGLEHRIEIQNPGLDYSIKFDSDDPDFQNISAHVVSVSEYDEIIGKLFLADCAGSDIGVRIKERYLDILLLRMLEKESPSLECRHIKDARIRGVVFFIRSNLLKRFDIDTLAGKAHISKYHFIKLFKKEVGETPFQYVQNLKLEKAISLLRFSDCNVSQIADALSFPDLQTFSRAFKNKTGMAPLNYRKACETAQTTPTTCLKRA